MALWNTAATVAQLVGVDAAGLVSAILQAARTARRNRKECRLLARRVMMVGDLLQLLQDSETTRRPEVRRALDGLGGALRQAYELVESCQDGSPVYGFIMAGRQAEQFRDVQDEIDSYLLVFPVVSHIDITRRLDRIYDILLPSGSSQQVSEEVPGSRTSHLEPDVRNQENALELIQLESNKTITELLGVGEDQRADRGVLQVALEQFLSNKAQGHQEGVEELSIRDQRFNWLCWWQGVEPGLKHMGNQDECAVFDLLKAATNNFSSENKLGCGGSATIYKGQICNGLEVAIKRYYKDVNNRDYKTEYDVITKLQHPNIIKLLGHSTGGGYRILVYEYMPNRSLDKFIFGSGRLLLDWLSRFQIIEGIARGLLYLHTHTLHIVHRDVKPSNVLLDSDMSAKISDFGIAKILPTEGPEPQAIVGTYGYMAPEYALYGILTTKVDVYAFGITLLEIIAAKRTIDVCSPGNQKMSSHAWNLWATGRSVELLDPPLPIEHQTAEVMVMKCVQIALLCVQQDPADRPNMSDVLDMLTSENISLPDPEQPDWYQREDTSEEMLYIDSASEATWGSSDLTWPR